MHTPKTTILLFVLAALPFQPLRAQEYDLVVYGGTSAGVMAAIQAKRMGKSVVLVCPDKHLGGLSSGGLGFTDTGDKSVIGGLSRDFYHRVWLHYDQPGAWQWQSREEYGNKGQGTPAIDGALRTMWIFEPHVAEQVFEDFIKEYDVPVERAQWLDRAKGVHKDGARITSITMLSGRSYSGRMFIDATYEGDLMAAAGVAYTVGRESQDTYGEHWNGVQTGVLHHRHHFGVLKRKISPYKVPGDPGSGLLPRISPDPPGEYGQGDKRVQAYCYRLCLTDDPRNLIPFPKPEGYDPSQYELLLRIFDAGWRETFAKFDPIPNHKTDVNNHGPFSTDNIGFSYDYPEASYERRRGILKEHETYEKGWLYFIANDPRVPKDVQARMRHWGLSKDEFTDNGGWPHQIYVREARRMLGAYVMTENDLLKKRTTPDCVGMGSYGIDSHNVQRYVTPEGYVQNEGDIGVSTKGPYGIAYGALVPKSGQCDNLLVPVCVSASHIAFGSIRMEPVFMILGQSTATAAAIAIDNHLTVQRVPYSALREQLLKDGQVLDAPEHPANEAAGIDPKKLAGILVDDAQASFAGQWTPSAAIGPWVGEGYRHDGNARDGKASARFETRLPRSGRYEVRFAYTAHPNRASRVQAEVHAAQGQRLVLVNEKQTPPIEGLFVSLGQFDFETNSPAAVVISNEGADGYVVVDAVQWVSIQDSAAAVPSSAQAKADRRQICISGTYPGLAVFNDAGECGIGAVAPWAGKLWFLTYPPHDPNGGPDKLWRLDSNLAMTACPESVGGTHANRMIHRESQQLIIGPYLIDSNANVRVISPGTMPGRITATARHLADPAHHVYFLTMENGLYDVDVNTLDVKTIFQDGNTRVQRPLVPFPATHAKGGYTGQGRLVCADNGERGWSFTKDPHFNGPAGMLAEHFGTNWAEPWQVVERKNFTEVTGPGGIYGAADNADPLWSLGWDKRSVILKLLDHGAWRTYRLPKGSYSQDALHGWYTEWPRIREIVDDKLLMHMHGMFYYFPKTFCAANSAGIQPICTFLKMPVDYCWWDGRLVMARDVSSTTGGNRWAGQSDSALWFGQFSDLENWGAPAGVGGPWQEDSVKANVPSDPFLVSGFEKRVLHLKHASPYPVSFAVEYDSKGDGQWMSLTNVLVAADGYAWLILRPELKAAWIRLIPDRDVAAATACFHLANPPTKPEPALFKGIPDAAADVPYSDGVIRAQTGDARTLEFAADMVGDDGALSKAYYEIDGSFHLRRATNSPAESTLRTTYGLAKADFSEDAASVIVTQGKARFRLPKSAGAYDSAFASGWPRGIREVVTERNLLNVHGTFYELPRADAGGFRRIRPITTHHKHISDYASWRGLFVVSGVASDATDDGHVLRSDDGQAALWFGNIDDLWRMGPPAGVGGPWKQSHVRAGAPSDPYLMYGYDRKELELSHTASEPVTFTVEVDFSADGSWSQYARFVVPPGQVFKHVFPDGYSGHWVRLKTDRDATVTATFTYGPRENSEAAAK